MTLLKTSKFRFAQPYLVVQVSHSVKIYDTQEIDNIHDWEGRVYEDKIFRHCTFKTIGFSKRNDPELRTTVRNVQIESCSVSRACTLNSTIFEDVTIDRLKMLSDGLSIWGGAFKHVTMKGRIGTLTINVPSIETDGSHETIDALNQDYYKGVDWALDISEAQFAGEVNLRYVPASLVIRDPETQVLVSKERAEKIDYQSMDFGEAGSDFYINDIFIYDLDAIVIVAPKLSPNQSNYLRAIDLLRSSGLAVPEEDLDHPRR